MIQHLLVWLDIASTADAQHVYILHDTLYILQR